MIIDLRIAELALSNVRWQQLQDDDKKLHVKRYQNGSQQSASQSFSQLQCWLMQIGIN